MVVSFSVVSVFICMELYSNQRICYLYVHLSSIYNVEYYPKFRPISIVICFLRYYPASLRVFVILLPLLRSMSDILLRVKASCESVKRPLGSEILFRSTYRGATTKKEAF